MGSVSRRAFVLGAASGVLVSSYGGAASATVARAMSLSALVGSSRHVLVVTALDAESHIEEIGRRRRVVTDTRVRVEETVAKGASDTELMVRTLGGAVGRLGERVDGQAQWTLAQPCVAFLLRGPDGLHYVNGMAQGHYPLRGKDNPKLTSSPDLPQIIDFESSAVKALVGSELRVAAERIRGLVAR